MAGPADPVLRAQPWPPGTTYRNMGYLYVTRPWPDLSSRLKLGHSQRPLLRLVQHQKTLKAPDIELLRTWPLNGRWERATIAAAAVEGCRPVYPSTEIFDVTNIEAMYGRIEAFIASHPVLSEDGAWDAVSTDAVLFRSWREIHGRPWQTQRWQRIPEQDFRPALELNGGQ